MFPIRANDIQGWHGGKRRVLPGARAPLASCVPRPTCWCNGTGVARPGTTVSLSRIVNVLPNANIIRAERDCLSFEASCTTIAFTRSYLYLYTDAMHEAGMGPSSWTGLVMRQVGCAVAWSGGVGTMHALMLDEFGVAAKVSSGAATNGGPRGAVDLVLAKLEHGLVRLKCSLSPQDRTLLLACLMLAAPASCFVQCIRCGLNGQGCHIRGVHAISPANDCYRYVSMCAVCCAVCSMQLCTRLLLPVHPTCQHDTAMMCSYLHSCNRHRPFFDKHGATPPGPFQLYISFLCMYLLGTLEVEHLRAGLLRKLRASQVWCLMPPSSHDVFCFRTLALLFSMRWRTMHVGVLLHLHTPLRTSDLHLPPTLPPSCMRPRDPIYSQVHICAADVQLQYLFYDLHTYTHRSCCMICCQCTWCARCWRLRASAAHAPSHAPHPSTTTWQPLLPQPLLLLGPAARNKASAQLSARGQTAKVVDQRQAWHMHVAVNKLHRAL